MKELAIKTF